MAWRREGCPLLDRFGILELMVAVCAKEVDSKAAQLVAIKFQLKGQMIYHTSQYLI